MLGVSAELTFARTRLQPPRLRGDLIHRPALEADLQQALAEQRLTLIVAPAGWGKTSALARQIAHLPERTALAWLSADADDDLQRFLAGLTAALAPFDLPWRVAPLALATLLQSERGTRAVADEIVNALADSEVGRGLIVIDDTHRWREPRLFELLAATVDQLPAHWGVVISSRTEPALPIARWRARGELAEFRQPSLRFEVDEIRELLQSRGLAADGAEDLEARTQGWAVGLRLMLTVGKATGREPSRSQRDVFDYLATEVFENMAPDMQQFLLRCSVLPELTAERCAHVSGQPNASALFAQIEQEGLFITPIDDAGTTLRLHDLFRDFLEERLRRERADEIPALLVRAAEQEPNLLRAVSWLVRAGAIDRAEAMLVARGQALLPVGGQADLLRMLGMLPAATVEKNPDLAFLQGMCAFVALDFETMARTMAAAEQGYLASKRHDMALFARTWKCCGLLSSGGAAGARAGLEQIRDQHRPAGALGAMVAVLLAYAAEAELRVDDVVPAVREMVAQLETVPDSPVWDQVTFLRMLALYPGAPETFERHIRNAVARHNPRAIATRLSVSHLRATLALGKGQFSQALEHLSNADDDLEWLGRPRMMLEENTGLHAYVHWLTDDQEAARRSAELTLSTLQRTPRAYLRVHSSLSRTVPLRTFWLLGDAEGVRRIREELQAGVDPWEWGTAPIARGLADGMVAMLDEDWEQAEASLLVAARLNPWTNLGLGLNARVLAAEAQRQQGRLDAAAATLHDLLVNPHLPNVFGCALLVGKDIIAALAHANWGRRLSLPEQAELARWATFLGIGEHESIAESGGLPAGLTSREAEVLDLIAKGHSNKLIARDLSLSLFTVKRHVANILGKTELTSRTELATWWLGKRRTQ
jgi:LuxR family maltose regulon positive regulatory protein